MTERYNGNGFALGNRIDGLLEGCSQPTIFAFCGLTSRLAKTLACNEYSISGVVAGESTPFFSPSDFARQKRLSVGQILSADGPVLMLFEQLLELRGTIDELFDGKVVVVRNNLFLDGEGVPSPVDPDLLDGFESSFDDMTPDTTGLSKYYAKSVKVGSAHLVTPIIPDEFSEWEVIDLFDRASFALGDASAISEGVVPVSSAAFLEYRLGLLDGTASLASVLVNARELESYRSALEAVASVTHALGLSVSFVAQQDQEEKVEESGRLLSVLQHYWGKDASFRKLRFYKNPDFDNEMETVSQGAISEFVVKQAEAAHAGSVDYRNVFVTAPTGAGKSILFQIPALYLARKYQLVTLVIEPLKALMIDQVANLRKRGVKNVVAINSDIPYGERLESLDRVKSGEASIIYLSPELLLESSIQAILNGRELGLVVIDEVHTVTSWGKDFRPDYWYLGPYLSKLRKNGMSFPIFCLTATAVYGGRDDVVSHTVADLELGNCKTFLGNPRRNGISFDIVWRSKSELPGPIEEVKTDLAEQWIDKAVRDNRHAIVYCPYQSHVNAIIDQRSVSNSKVLGYHGGKDAAYKKIVQDAFASGSCRVLVSTKAFGMGIDIDDIDAVYHYAPTGNLSDYIQEIGRGGRKRGLGAKACIDFFMQDVRYSETLYALSKFSQWQLKEIMAKLYEVYASAPQKDRSQNFLVSPNTFSYLFTNEKDEDRKTNRVKSALMMISRDLEDKFNFPVIVVRPKVSYTRQFVCIEQAAEHSFTTSYGKYLRKISEAHTRYENRAGQHAVKISDMGAIYELNVGDMWANEFSDLTFADFKRQLFTGKICSPTGEPALSNRLALDINYSMPFDEATSTLSAFAEALHKTFMSLAREGDFSEKEFTKELTHQLEGTSLEVKKPSALLNAFVRPVDSGGHFGSDRSFKCIKRFNKSSRNTYSRVQDVRYGVIGRELQAAMSNLTQTLGRLQPPEGSKHCRRYLDNKALDARYALAEILEILKLATYTVKGGDNPEIFIRLNDASKVKALASDNRYSNGVLRELNDRHEYSSKVIRGFFRSTMSDSERWDVVEEYFLGNDDYVAQVLGIDEKPADESTKAAPKVRHAVAKRPTGLSTSVVAEGASYEGKPYFRVWKDLLNSCSVGQEITDVQKLKELVKSSKLEMPRKDAVVCIESTDFKLHPALLWKKSRVMLFSASRADEFAHTQDIGWKCFILGQGEGIEAIADAIENAPKDAK